MAVLPVIVGVVAGVPLVASELEARTAHTAWSIYASRTRWLAHQLLPTAALVFIVASSASLVSGWFADEWIAWGQPSMPLIGLHGAIALVRVLACLAVGLLVGALIGRTIPGAILAGALCISLIIGTSLARDAWLASLPATIIATPGESGEVDIPASAIFTGDAWEAPDGAILTTEEARRIATDGGVPPAESGDEQDARAAVWLSEHGYTPVVMGITDDRASAWAGYDLLIFGAAGLLSAGASFAVVRRRRPD